MAISKDDIARVKGQGFLLNRGTDCFSGRVVSPGGVYSAAQMAHIAACAEKFGNGKVTITSRQSAELPGIALENIEAAAAFLAQQGLSFGGTGPKVRPVTACKGTTCVYGNIDTQGIAKALHERFYLSMGDVRLPHKFKIGVGGCPNSCMKPSLNDIGVEGHRSFQFDPEACKGCKNCAVAAACPSKAIRREGERAVLDESTCLSCGVCIGKCPFGAIPQQADAVCRIYVGGTWGRAWRMGKPLSRMVAQEEVGNVVEKAMLWYRENGYAHERFALTLDRIGMEDFEAAISGDDLLKRREAILAAPIRQRD